MGLMTASCIFCSGRWLELHHDVHGPHDAFVGREDDWFLVVDVAPVTRGHLLMVPSSHARSALSLLAGGSVPQQLTKSVHDLHQVLFGEPPILIEHGLTSSHSPGASRRGPCIDHAHVHVVPQGAVDWPLLAGLPVLARDADAATAMSSACSVTSFYCLRHTNGLVTLYSADGTPHQFLRRYLLRGRSTWQGALRDPVTRSSYANTLSACRQASRELVTLADS
jgi:diadenosine tetraphosphate (Ap4A) HIT family hydrolase